MNKYRITFHTFSDKTKMSVVGQIVLEDYPHNLAALKLDMISDGGFYVNDNSFIPWHQIILVEQLS